MRQPVPSPLVLRARTVHKEPFTDAVEATLDAGRSFQEIDGFRDQLCLDGAELHGFVNEPLRPPLDERGNAGLSIIAPELMDWHRQAGWEEFYQHPDVDIAAFHNYDWFS